MELNSLKIILIGMSLASVVGFGIGCTPEEDEADEGGMSDMAAALEQSAQTVAEPTPPAPKPAPAVPEAPAVVTAKTPKRGKKLHDRGTYMSAVFSARFRAEHQMVLNQVKQAKELYRATNGYYPKSHVEFMEEIIEPNMIHLPELDSGYEYWYDTSDHLLKQRPIPEEAQAEN